MGGLALVCVGFVLMYAARLGYAPKPVVLWAGLASTGFVVAAWPRRGDRQPFGTLMFLGLCACWLGDVIGPGNFMAGVYAFLAAHLFLAVGQGSLGIAWARVLCAVPVILVVNGVYLAWVARRIAEAEFAGILGYALVISVMLLSAAGASRKRPALLLAAVTFFISDLFVGLWHFADLSIAGWICYPLYYAACLLFAWCAHLPKQSAPDAEH